MVEGGLEKRAVVAEWTNRFKFYVPLNGLSEDQMDAETQAYPSQRIGHGHLRSIYSQGKG